jgi:hypothetical protein
MYISITNQPIDRENSFMNLCHHFPKIGLSKLYAQMGTFKLKERERIARMIITQRRFDLYTLFMNQYPWAVYN